MDFGAALIGLVISFVTKVAIMAYAGTLLMRCYRSEYPGGAPRRIWLVIPKDERPRFRILFLSLVFFFISEIVCGIEIYIFLQTSDALRAIHSIASSTGMGLFALGMYRVLDRKVLKHATTQCALNRVCRGCPVVAGGECRFSSVFLIAATFLALAAIPLFFAETSRIAADPRRWLLPFPALNHWYDATVTPWLIASFPGYRPLGAAFFLPESTQILDFRILPAISLALLAIGIVIYSLDRRTRGLGLILFASGPLAYAYFELILNRATGDLFLGALGHEIGEFVFLVFVSEILTKLFPRGSGT